MEKLDITFLAEYIGKEINRLERVIASAEATRDFNESLVEAYSSYGKSTSTYARKVKDAEEKIGIVGPKILKLQEQLIILNELKF